MNEISSPFLALLSELTYSDSTLVTIKCNGGDVTAKKSLLTTVSDVFKYMLENNFLEKKKNTVMADDVDFPTMKFIIQCYTSETCVTCLQQMDNYAFEYIVEKYKLLGIREEAAEKLIDIYRETGNIQFLGKIFLICNGQKSRMTALKEAAEIVTAGQDAPWFVDLFNTEEFKEFSKICCDVLKNSEVKKWDGFLQAFYRWTLQDPEERSMVSLEVLGMINMEQFPVAGVLSLLQSLELHNTFQTINSISVKLLRYILKVEVENMIKIRKPYPLPKYSSSKVNCSKCGHNDEIPYHYSSKCMGKHLKCERTGCPHDGRVINSSRRVNCYERLPYPNTEARVFGSLSG